ncbi:deoxyribonuclease [Candidatus Micrarchaeota archaeon CG_4_10_14_0_2_um_filter_49_7]|nr:MAG: hypothetical protein AUJ13_04150 [Candidatus Micrarchaeota archaeon CG1_02_49_24]PIZ99495.1 MAG: deoxyribonuclease [Candidatus Micrarchaeota archaeon CG_4_10_14_0_2_um_filter_49_7]HII53432.1 TRAM domain-containing protein [Candidatus Micrarchaeota archaeon]
MPITNIAEGEKYTVEILGANRKGEGIANVEGVPIFIKGAKAKESVNIKITKIMRTYAIGEIVK